MDIDGLLFGLGVLSGICSIYGASEGWAAGKQDRNTGTSVLLTGVSLFCIAIVTGIAK